MNKIIWIRPLQGTVSLKQWQKVYRRQVKVLLWKCLVMLLLSHRRQNHPQNRRQVLLLNHLLVQVIFHRPNLLRSPLMAHQWVLCHQSSQRPHHRLIQLHILPLYQVWCHRLNPVYCLLFQTNRRMNFGHLLSQVNRKSPVTRHQCFQVANRQWRHP